MDVNNNIHLDSGWLVAKGNAFEVESGQIVGIASPDLYASLARTIASSDLARTVAVAQSQQRALVQAIRSRDPRAREAVTLRCACRRSIGKVYLWNGQQWLWMNASRLRLSETGRVISAPEWLVPLNDFPQHWWDIRVCRCGAGTLLSCHGIATCLEASGRPAGINLSHGYLVQRYSLLKDSDDAVGAGEIVLSFMVDGTSERRVGSGPWVRRLGKAFAGTVTE